MVWRRRRRGVPKVEVTFDIDANGILGVTAKDTASGKTQSIRITASTRLSEDDKKRMVDEAERYAEADQKRRDEVEQLNAADAACYEAEKMLANFGDKLSDDIKKRIETALRETKEALLKKDVKLASERVESLKKVLQEAGTAIYSQAAPAGAQAQVEEAGTEARPSGAGPRGKVVDADYKENP